MGFSEGLRESAFPASRLSTIDICALGLKKHHIAALLEVDVTQARALFRRYRAQNGESLSFTAWVAHCAAAAAGEFPQIAAYRSGRRKIAVSGTIDVAVAAEKRAGGHDVPLPFVIRNCGGKSVGEIHREVRQAQEERADEKTVVLGSGGLRRAAALFYKMPAFLRRFIWKTFLLRPGTAVRTMGSVMVTSLGMCGDCDGWFIPIGIHPLVLAIGSITKKPGVVDDRIAVREYLKLTALVDHDVIDGAPAARYMTRFAALLQSGDGL
ncbi:2-oxoacid dehydrogenases acyltransferase (catalytic domain) [Sporobacter termitidis DSM 10068]|uniref:2-oxoacid dehydrogenases acyltransferase (Catalytic domain) n=1 Tax=Sporobacter termitidis DSM 10068 TaxID=1123282 RepID=A0A1M5Z8W0_9FIRM|nr:2-oxo acid dehydrogenase subunit E2 [Sporobacter termitidis]SHI20665.1 2-oxoacid dehydrogenases acyltransferase (catalytic domain) [Sporobacter termitidis DSM 10068]